LLSVFKGLPDKHHQGGSVNALTATAIGANELSDIQAITITETMLNRPAAQV
jgi:hypothetical protein